MRHTKKILSLLITFTLISCFNKKENPSEENKQEIVVEQIDSTEINKQREEEEAERLRQEKKYLITENSVGFFEIGKSWQDLSKNDYGWENVKNYVNCVDGCCSGGFDLGKETVKAKDDGFMRLENKDIKKLEITIISKSFKDEDPYQPGYDTKYKKDPNLYFVQVDNCPAWYWKDKIGGIKVFSEAFKTKEGVGVGTTLETIKEKFGKFNITAGWLEEEIGDITFTIKTYPNLVFSVDERDLKAGVGNFESLSISNFKKNTKVTAVTVNNSRNK